MPPNSSSAFAFNPALIPSGSIPIASLAAIAGGNRVLAGPTNGIAGPVTARTLVTGDYQSTTIPINSLAAVAAGNLILGGPSAGGAGNVLARALGPNDFPANVVPISGLAAVGAGNLVMLGPVGGGAGNLSARALQAADFPAGVINSAAVTPGGSNLPWARLAGGITAGGGNNMSTFPTAIPATFTHLLVQILARSVAAATSDTLTITLNADTAAHYNREQVQGALAVATAGTSPLTTALHAALIPGANATAGIFAQFLVFMPNYALTTTNKSSCLNGGFADSAGGHASATLQQSSTWESTAAITRIDVLSGSNFTAGSQVWIYGLT
jgi:hypothetical protein